MRVYRLAYTSVVSRPLTKTDLKHILTTAVRHNKADGISGALCFSREAFVQVLEGDRGAVNRTFRGITKDIRHKELEVIGFEPTQGRIFGDWSMAFIDDRPETTDKIRKYCRADRFGVGDLRLLDVTALLLEMLGESID